MHGLTKDQADGAGKAIVVPRDAPTLALPQRGRE